MIAWVASGVALLAAGELRSNVERLGWWLRPYDHASPTERRWRWQRGGCLRPEQLRMARAVQGVVDEIADIPIDDSDCTCGRVDINGKPYQRPRFRHGVTCPVYRRAWNMEW